MILKLDTLWVSQTTTTDITSWLSVPFIQRPSLVTKHKVMAPLYSTHEWDMWSAKTFGICFIHSNLKGNYKSRVSKC